jgi:ABC-type bacteriocin/lantibiotic exporter with double-glycine peptidase domain
MQLTNKGRPGCDVQCIYDIIGKKTLSVTNLKDLLFAAERLGISAQGEKLTLDDLESLPGYAILPVGNQSASPDNPQHFILVRKAENCHITIIDPKTLQSNTVPIHQIKPLWKGYALVFLP